jgi:hypothetical protein
VALEQALAIQTELGDEQRQARVHSRFGRALGGFPATHADIPRSLGHLERAIEILERGDNQTVLAVAVLSMASAQHAGLRSRRNAKVLAIAGRLGNGRSAPGRT